MRSFLSSFLQLQELKALLPQLQTNKHAILQSAVDYISKLQKQCERLMIVNKELRDENEEIVRFLQATTNFFDGPQNVGPVPSLDAMQQQVVHPHSSQFPNPELHQHQLNIPFPPLQFTNIPQVESPPYTQLSTNTTTGAQISADAGGENAKTTEDTEKGTQD